MLTREDVTSVYKGDIVGREIVFFDSTTSTNDRALGIGLQRPEPEGLVVVADTQTSGRGRPGRTMEGAYKFLLNRNKRGLITEWNRLNCTIGKRVTVRRGKRVLSGTAEGITDEGELLLRLSSGEMETARSGEVTILKN